MKIECRILNEAEFDSWDQFVATSIGGSIYASAQYLEILGRYTNCRFRIAALESGGKIVAGLPLFERPTRWGSVVEPRLLLQYNGFVVGKPASTYPSQQKSAEIQQADTIAEFVEKQQFAGTLLKCRWPLEDGRVFLDRGWRVWPTYTYLMPLSDLSSQWDLVDRNIKRLIRRCADQQLTLTQDDDFDSFFRMHTATHVRKGAPIYLPKKKFEGYFRELQDLGIARLYHARRPDGRSLAALLVLAGSNSIADFASAAADEEFLNTGANAFVRWRVFEDLAKSGYTYADLTDASLNSVTRFKSQFGGGLQMCLTLSLPPTRLKRLGQGLESAARSIVKAPLRLAGRLGQ